MDKDDYEKRVVPILRVGEGCLEYYSSSYEFKRHLNQGELEEERLKDGWIFWRSGPVDATSHKSIKFLRQIAKHCEYNIRPWDCEYNILMQFWAAKEVEGGNHYLSNSNQPFLVSRLAKGVSEYRKKCIEIEREGSAEDLGGVGRAYRNKLPESTPDLRLYSTNEFPLRDQALSCGFRGYLALPLFDFHNQNQCYGVLEFLYPYSILQSLELFSKLCGILETAGLTSTTHCYRNEVQVEREITDTLELAIKVVSHLSLAQVWAPCKQCNNSRCMERAFYIHSQHTNEHSDTRIREIKDYVDAWELQNLRIGVESFDRYLSHVSISENPLAHYAQRARLSLGFAIALQSPSNHSYVIQFFLQPKYREDSSMQSLINIMEMKLKSFKFELGGKLLEEFTLPNPIEMESIDMLKLMDSYKEEFSESDFTKYLETDDLCCLQSYIKEDYEECYLQPYIKEDCKDSGDHENSEDSYLWVFHSPNERVGVKEKIENFMKELAVMLGNIMRNLIWRKEYMIQFWSPIVDGDRRCLKTSDQSYALSCLGKGLASFRKKCITHHYLADEEAKEDGLGPVGRVFRNGHLECLYDLFSYSVEDFPMRNYALHCGIGTYFAYPVFDEFNKHDCVGVLEFLGFDQYNYPSDDINFHYCIKRALKAAKLWSTDFDSYRTSMEVNSEAMAEIKIAFDLISEIPQCHEANVWIPCGKCTSSNSRCMICLNPIREHSFHAFCVKPKTGMIGVVLESESKSCLFQNIGEFSIAHQPLEYYGKKQRSNTCYTICLQSSHTGDLLYVFEFFLCQSPATYDYLMSFLNFLLPIIKHELESFKLASGKQLGEEELVVEVIQFSQANQFTFSESDQSNVFPVKFKSVPYYQKEEQQVQSNPEAEQSKKHNVDASIFKKTKKRKKRKSKHRISLEDLMSHCHKTQDEAANDLNVSLSTIKRVCREHDFKKWHDIRKQARNASLSERERRKGRQQDMRPNLQGERRELIMDQNGNADALNDKSDDIKDDSVIVNDDDEIEQYMDGIYISQGESTAITTSFIANHNDNANASLPIPMSNVSNNAVVAVAQNKNTNAEPLWTEDEAEKVMIKVKYENNNIRFELCLSSGVIKVREEVVKRLNLEMGSFNLKYMDEDDEEILIACDEDLQLCPKTRTAVGKTCIHLFVSKQT